MMRTSHSPNRILRSLAALTLLAAAASCTDDSSPLNVVPTEPTAHQVTGASIEQSATVNTAVAEAPTVRVTDTYGNPVSGVIVTFEATNGGSATPAQDTTGLSGEVATTWVLGTQAGSNTLTAEIDGTGSAAFSATGTPDSPAEIEVIAGGGQTDTVGHVLAGTVVVDVTDQYGNLVAGASVQWAPEDATASIQALASTTNDAGRITATWTLGEVAGEQRLEVLAGDATRFVTAVATPDVPTELRAESGDGLAAGAGSELIEPLSVRLVDRFGNGVPDRLVAWETVQGGGSPDPDTSRTGAAGIAETRYTVGMTPGEEEVTATFAGLDPVTLAVRATEPNNMNIDGMYLTQAAQDYDASVPLIAGRDGFLRIFGRADSANVWQPIVEVRFYLNGALVETDTIEAPGTSVPLATNEGLLSSSWNLSVPGSLIQPGLSIVADIDAGEAYFESDETDNIFPAGGASVLADVRTAETFMVRLVPVFVPAESATGDVNAGNAESYLIDAFKMFPIADYDFDVRSTFTTEASSLSDSDGWSTIIQEIRALRTAEGSARYYYGVLPAVSGAAFCGLGYLGLPVAIGLDGCGAATAAHEWGHNFDRLHTPCGDPANPDPDYPYANARIGTYGFDIQTSQLKSSTAYADLMSYCAPEWISDYTYKAVLQFRAAEGDAPALRVGPEPAVILWGGTREGRLQLEPAFEATTTPLLPRGTGPYRLLGFDEDGATLFSLAFSPERVDHLADDHRHFAFAIPVRLLNGRQLARVQLSGPGAPPVEIRAAPAAADLQHRAIVRTGRDSGLLRLEWDADAFPLVVVRDPASGDILALARGGDAVVRTAAPELDLAFTSGIGTLRRTVRVP